MSGKKGEISEEAKQRLLRMFEVSLWLDTYEDIFSDFDPRPFAERALSYDFLEASKRATRDKPSGQIELKLLIPKQKRDLVQESTIRRRLKEYFDYHHDLHLSSIKKMLWEGFAFIFCGVTLMFLASYILFMYHEKTFFINFIIILLEPGGWFLFWEGLNQVIFESRVKRSESEFFKKMSNCKINFVAY